MSKKMSKILLSILLVLIIGIQLVHTVQASDLDSNVKSSLDNFLGCINDGNNNVYNYIDTSNTELYNNVEKYLHDLRINYQITNITEENDIYTIETQIAAEGIGWSVSGFTVTFELKEIDNQYIITNTNLFDVIGIENVFSFILKILAVIGGVILIIIVIIVLIVIRMKKKNKGD